MSSNKTILIIDDEEMIRNVISRMLKTKDYQVLEAVNGEQALEMLADNLTSVNFVLLDLSMPGMSGEETFDRLKQMNSELKIIISTGYISNDLKNDLIRKGALKIMEKPFEMKDLLDLIIQNT